MNYFRRIFRLRPDEDGLIDLKGIEKYAEEPLLDNKSNQRFYGYLDKRSTDETSLDTFLRFGFFDFGKPILEQIKNGTNPSKKQIDVWTKNIRYFIDEALKEKDRDRAINLTERILNISKKRNLDYFYLLRNLYVKSMMASSDNRESKLEKVIYLEERLSKLENKLTGANTKYQSELVLNILQDCKTADEELFLRMIKFVDGYYNRNKITI